MWNSFVAEGQHSAQGSAAKFLPLLNLDSKSSQIAIKSTPYSELSLKVLLGFIVLVILVKVVENTTLTPGTDSLCSDLLYQAVQWKDMCTQDKSAVFRLQHANYAMAYMNAARHIAKDDVLEQQNAVDVHKLLRKIKRQQESALKDVSLTCPGIKDKQTKPHTTGWVDA
jgi:hypothetical protein